MALASRSPYFPRAPQETVSSSRSAPAALLGRAGRGMVPDSQASLPLAGVLGSVGPGVDAMAVIQPLLQLALREGVRVHGTGVLSREDTGFRRKTLASGGGRWIWLESGGTGGGAGRRRNGVGPSPAAREGQAPPGQQEGPGWAPDPATGATGTRASLGWRLTTNVAPVALRYSPLPCISSDSQLPV